MFKQSLLIIALNSLLALPSLSQASAVAEAEQALANGQINNAISLLQAAPAEGTPAAQMLNHLVLAEAQLRAGHIEAAEAELRKANKISKTGVSKVLDAELALRFGHLNVAKADSENAEKEYRQALSFAEAIPDHALAAAALINIAKLNFDNQALTQAQNHIAKLSSDDNQQALLLALAHQATEQNAIELAQHSLQAVLKANPTPRHKAQALGNLGHLYELQQRTAEGLQLTEQALLADNSPDQALIWRWQQARLQEQAGQTDAALNGYRSAVQQLQSIRADIPVVYQGGQSSFKQTFAPIYLGLIERLLYSAEKANPETEQALLNEVVQTWEQLKTVELQDYFKDACAVKQKAQSNSMERNTALLYPILLSDNSTLILKTKDQFKAYRIAHSAAEIETLVATLSEELTSGQPINANKTLYTWLIAPINADLQAQHIDTLVYLPDGALRKVPFSLLSDGNDFLINHYALVTVPGMSLLSAVSKDTNRKDILLAGMSKPGPVIEELLSTGINLFGPADSEKRSAARGLTLRDLPIRDAPIENVSLTERNMRASQLKEELALPGVTQELKTLSNLTEQPVLENTNFLVGPFQKSVNQGHAAVHIASHGFFSGDPKKSFIMAYDHLLTMNQLTELFQTEAFHDRPIELVTLSACQTAEGDDRSPLGLSGVVVQTGVKSAIGTLWPVADEAARQFFSDFYMQYQKPGNTKAKAMQYAQQQLMKNKALSHPAYWGPFVLVGEWH